jgi:small-conductance mechanosensitive channel/CRP-like cAMP-binding protein
MAWLQELSAYPILDAFLCVGLALAALVLRQLAHRSRLGKRLNASFTLIVVGLLVGALGICVRLAGFPGAAPYFDAALFGALAIGLVRTALTVFVDFYLRQREGAIVSAIIRDVASVIAYFVVIVAVLRTTLNINLPSLVATSAVLTVIVGLALQDVLGNLFSGLVLELEAPFAHGDWVRIGSFEGTIEETGWRTTKIRTRVNELVTLPNAMLAKEAVVNYSRPDPRQGETLHFEAAYEAPPNLVKDVVAEVLRDDPDVVRSPLSEVWLDHFGESGVGYAIRYWITNFAARERIRDRIQSNIWYALRRANVRIPFPARDIFVHRGAHAARAVDHADLMATLRQVPLLAPLDDAALGRLAARVRRLTFGQGEVVVREGDQGDSFYVIERGAAEVTLRGRAERTLDDLGAGSFFGEMSLLAGEPRTATVSAATDLDVLVVDREAFRDIISADPALLGPLSEIAARRQAATEEQQRLLEARRAEVPDGQQAQRLRERIRAFFRL